MNYKDHAKKSIKLLVASVLHYSKLLSLYRNRVMQNKAVILVYHRIINDNKELSDYSSYGITVTKNDFEKQIRFLKKTYNIISLQEYIECIKNKRQIPDNACIITFDDGWRDNYTNAYPILKKYSVPATIFLATNFINGGNWFWSERVKYLLAHYYDAYTKTQLSDDSKYILTDKLTKHGINSLLTTPQHGLADYLTEICNQIKETDKQNIAIFLEDLEALKEVPGLDEPRRFMNWAEISELSENNIDIGAHTMSHASLPECSKENIDYELYKSRELIQSKIHKPVALFAYPYGKSSDEARTSLKQNHYDCACTLVPNFNDITADPFSLGRIDIYQGIAPSVAFFACRILRFMKLF